MSETDDAMAKLNAWVAEVRRKAPTDVAAILETADGASRMVRVPYPPPHIWRTAVRSNPWVYPWGPIGPLNARDLPEQREYDYMGIKPDWGGNPIALYRERTRPRPSDTKEGGG